MKKKKVKYGDTIRNRKNIHSTKHTEVKKKKPSVITGIKYICIFQSCVSEKEIA